MNFETPDLLPAVPEMFVLGMACVVLVVDLFLRDEQREVSYRLTQATLLGALALSLLVHSAEPQVTFNGTFVSDPMSTVLKVFIYLFTLALFVYSRHYLKDRDLFRGEYFVLGLFGVLGMMVMTSAYSFVTVFLGLELMSLSLYAMVALHRDSPRASEAAMKYFVLGAIATGMLLYGMSILYGLSGSLNIGEVSGYILREGDAGNVALAFALVFVVVGLAFKLGAVPFHMWLPDVYQGAPSSVTVYIGTAPKLAAFAVMLRLLAEGLGALHAEWQGMLVVLAVLSLAVGNLIAIAQHNIKRMLAYSTIAHVGFILLGLLAGTEEGYSAAMFYTLTYVLMALGAFGMVILLSRDGAEAEALEDFRGLADRNVWLALLMALIMFSMAGIPPTVGFYAKLAVLQSVLQVEMLWLAVFAVVMSVIGAFYYLRVIKLMFMDAAPGALLLRAGAGPNAVMSINGLLVVILGLFPGGLMSLCASAINL